MQQAGDKLVVPANCIDRWFIKFTERFRWVLCCDSLCIRVLHHLYSSARAETQASSAEAWLAYGRRRDPNFLTREKSEI